MTGYAADQLDQALEGVEVVVIPAGVPRKVCLLQLKLSVCTDLLFLVARRKFLCLIVQ